MILQPSCSPKKLTLAPTTGPRSRSTGWSREFSADTKRAMIFVGCAGASPASGSAGSLRRRENRSESATDMMIAIVRHEGHEEHEGGLRVLRDLRGAKITTDRASARRVEAAVLTTTATRPPASPTCRPAAAAVRPSAAY